MTLRIKVKSQMLVWKPPFANFLCFASPKIPDINLLVITSLIVLFRIGRSPSAFMNFWDVKTFIFRVVAGSKE
jgi:hypothetical protein